MFDRGHFVFVVPVSDNILNNKLSHKIAYSCPWKFSFIKHLSHSFIIYIICNIYALSFDSDKRHAKHKRNNPHRGTIAGLNSTKNISFFKTAMFPTILIFIWLYFLIVWAGYNLGPMS